MKLVQIKALFTKAIVLLKDRSASIDMSPLDPILDRLIPILENEDGSVTIKLGKVNFVVRERFAEKGKDVDELVERLIVEKCRQSA